MLRDAEAYLARQEISAARAAARRAASLAGPNPFLANLLGRIEEADNQYGPAREQFEAAVRLAPADANFRVSLAGSFIYTGEFDRARKEIGEALSNNPHHAGAFQLYAMITRIGPDDDFVGRVQEAIDRAGAETRKASKLHFVLGKALDDRGDFDNAFAAFRRANDLRQSAYSPDEHERFVERVIEAWPHSLIDRLRPLGFQSSDAVFIVGMPRSGSTLLQQRLAADTRVAALGEAGDIAAMSAAMERNHPRRAAYPDWCADAPDAAWRGFGEIYMRNAKTRRPGVALYVNKNLFNWLFGGVIMASLPGAHFIEIRRNPVDTCLSCYFADLHDAHNYSVRLETLGHMYRLCARLMTHWRDGRAGPTLVRYEDLVTDPAGTIAEIMMRAGLDASIASDAIDGPATQTFSTWQVRQPVHTGSIGRWRNYEKHLGPLIDSLGYLVA